MGANSSSPRGSPQASPKHRRRDPTNPRSDLAREQRLTAPAVAGSHSPNDHVRRVFSGEYDDNFSSRPGISVHTDIPSSQERHQQHHQHEPGHKKHLPHQHKPSPRPQAKEVHHAQRQQNSDHKVTSQPVIICNDHEYADPSPSKPTKGKQAKIKISKFTELKTPKETQPQGGSHGNLHEPGNQHHLSIPLQYDPSVRRGSEASALRRLQKKSNNQEFTQRMEEKRANLSGQARKRSELRRGSAPATVINADLRMTAEIIPAPDYDDDQTTRMSDKPDGQTPLHRINTLEYFDKLTSEHSPLHQFEKVKPARANKKGNSPSPSRAYQQRQKKEDPLRPKSMFLTPTTYKSDLDISSMHNQSAIAAEDMSQDPTRDDADCLGRKKMAGERLPIGEVSPAIESKFLMSLKRNIELREGRQMAKARPTSRSLEHIVF